MSYLKRKTPLRSDPEKTRAWQNRSRQKLPQRSKKRSREESKYNREHTAFLVEHPVCPVTGEVTTSIHHSAKREGQWINLQRYWIAVSLEGHKIIEDHKEWAEDNGLMFRIYVDYNTHVQQLRDNGINIFEPVFYRHWDGKLITR